MITNDSLNSAFARGGYREARAYAQPSIEEQAGAEPKTSFFRGATIGLAIMLPVWGAVIVLILR